MNDFKDRLHMSLDNMPLPHYLKTESIKLSEDENGLSGIVVFPSDDSLMKNRGRRVNTTLHLFAVWNAAYILKVLKNVERPYVTESTTKAFKPTKVDRDMFLKVSLRITDETSKRVVGLLFAEFRNISGDLCHQISTNFIAKKLPSTPTID